MRKLLAYACLLGAILVGIYLIPTLRAPGNRADVLPAQVKVDSVIDGGNDASIMDQLGLTFRLESCGAIVFSLSSETVDRLKAGGLAFLADALQARGFADRSYYRYAGWHETPVPPNWSGGDGVIAGSLHCADIYKPLWRRIAVGIGRPGGFYAEKPEGQLILLPDEGLAVFTYYG